MIRSKKTLNRSRIASIARNQPNLARAALLDALKPNRPSARVAAMAAMLVASGCASTQVSYSGMDAPGLRTADEALRVGSTQLALQVSESVLRTAPSNGNALEIKADALAQLGKTDEAAAIFQTLLSQNPDNIRANIGMGRIKLLTDASVAEPLFQRVLRADPTNLTALNNLGIAGDLSQGAGPEPEHGIGRGQPVALAGHERPWGGGDATSGSQGAGARSLLEDQAGLRVRPVDVGPQG
jgi:tetratricopeptide (TPR) repeat protein